MSHKLSFYPLGNAETILLQLSNNKIMLMDYADMDTCNGFSLKKELTKIDTFDVVMFNHAHEDHVKGASEFFEFEHAEKYKGNGRKKIKDLWISSAFMLDTNLCEDARVIRQEARYRLKNREGITVFASPDSLDKWLEENDLSTNDDDHNIVHAGKLLSNFNHHLGDEILIFVHAPFSEDCNDVEDRNEPSIVLQIRLTTADRGKPTNIFITGDVKYTILEKVVDRSEVRNGGYLDWDILDIPHHCSYTGLSNEKGDGITEPSIMIKNFLKDRSSSNAIMVASCHEFNDNTPPHIEAKKAYIKYSNERRFISTSDSSKPIVFEIDQFGFKRKFESTNPITASPAPRAG
jgi:ribonuclease BN (tRNA processing enzyme)